MNFLKLIFLLIQVKKSAPLRKQASPEGERNIIRNVLRLKAVFNLFPKKPEIELTSTTSKEA